MLSTKIKEQVKPFIKRLFPTRNTPRTGAAAVGEEWEWSIGIYMGNSPFDFVSPDNVHNPVLTRKDVSGRQALFVADPFMIRANHSWYMFFEVYCQTDERRKGEIGLATSENGLIWRYQQIVLAEPFHLSYPYVFEWMNEFYMIPESCKAGSVRLYKAVQFPVQWSFVGTLLAGAYYVDSSVFRYRDKWWLLTESNPTLSNDTLRLFFADDLLGPWLEHPQSPIIAGNPHIARPAGRVLSFQNTVVRYAQDCYPIYGTRVRAFEIMELTTQSYQEREIKANPVLTASGVGWNESGMHHIDPHPLPDGGWLACVDGRIHIVV